MANLLLQKSIAVREIIKQSIIEQYGNLNQFCLPQLGPKFRPKKTGINFLTFILLFVDNCL